MKYKQIDFDEPWQAAKFVADGGVLKSIGSDGAPNLSQSEAASWVSGLSIGLKLYTIDQQFNHWTEKLDSTPNNAVLCIDSDGRLRIAFTFSDGQIFDEYMDMIHQPIPMEKAEIMLLANNAPE